MVLITIEPAKKKVARAPDLPYSISFPDAKAVTIEDVKKLLSVKFPKVRLGSQTLDKVEISLHFRTFLRLRADLDES